MKEPKHATARARRTQLPRKKAPRPRKVANSAQRSTRESTSAPRGLATPACRATPPSRTSSVPATMVSRSEERRVGEVGGSGGVCYLYVTHSEFYVEDGSNVCVVCV